MSQLAASEGQPRVNGGGAGFFLHRLETVRPQSENAGRSGMTGDCHVSICGGVGVRFPCATRLSNRQHPGISTQATKWANPQWLFALTGLTFFTERR